MKRLDFQLQPRRINVDPAFELSVRLSMVRGAQVVLHVGGYIALDGKVISNIFDGGYNDGGLDPFLTPGMLRPDNIGVMERGFGMVAPLSHAAIDHIEAARRKNKPGDVNLQVELEIRWLEMNATATPLKLVQLAGGGPAQFVLGLGYSADESCVALVPSSKEVGAILTFKRSVEIIKHRISGSDWIHDFAPQFGGGRFVVVELPEPTEAVTSDAKLLAEWDEALKSARQARDHLLRGDDPEAMEALRKPIELLRNKADDLKDLLMRDGYNAEGATAFVEVVKAQFALFSKFHHRLDRAGKMAPEIKPQREDVLHAYSTTMTMLNMLARKVARLG